MGIIVYWRYALTNDCEIISDLSSIFLWIYLYSIFFSKIFYVYKDWLNIDCYSIYVSLLITSYCYTTSYLFVNGEFISQKYISY